MIFPAETSVSSANGCTATIGGIAALCSIVSDSVTITHSQTQSVAGKQISVEFGQVINPPSTAPTSSFVILSQEAEAGIYYNIDGVTEGVTYSVSGLAQISGVTALRDSMNTNNDGLRTNQPTNFLFSFIIPSGVPSDGVFTFTMPEDSHAKINSDSTDFQCSSTS